METIQTADFLLDGLQNLMDTTMSLEVSKVVARESECKELVKL